jgi:hypothetical protein
VYNSLLTRPEDHFGDMYADGRIILKWMFSNVGYEGVEWIHLDSYHCALKGLDSHTWIMLTTGGTNRSLSGRPKPNGKANTDTFFYMSNTCALGGIQTHTPACKLPDTANSKPLGITHACIRGIIKFFGVGAKCNESA